MMKKRRRALLKKQICLSGNTGGASFLGRTHLKNRFRHCNRNWIFEMGSSTICYYIYALMKKIILALVVIIMVSGAAVVWLCWVSVSRGFRPIVFYHTPPAAD